MTDVKYIFRLTPFHFIEEPLKLFQSLRMVASGAQSQANHCQYHFQLELKTFIETRYITVLGQAIKIKVTRWII